MRASNSFVATIAATSLTAALALPLLAPPRAQAEGDCPKGEGRHYHSEKVEVHGSFAGASGGMSKENHDSHCEKGGGRTGTGSSGGSKGGGAAGGKTSSANHGGSKGASAK